MFIRWHGYGCFEFGDDDKTIAVDPHDGKSIGVWPPAMVADVVLVTHNSFDRNAVRTIKGIHQDFIGTLGVQDCNGFRFEGLPSFSDEQYGAQRGPNSIYLFTMDSIRVACCGCLGDLPIPAVIERLKGIDVLFVPVGEFGTLPMTKVNTFLAQVGARVVVPTDFRVGGITLPLSPLSSFMEGRSADDFVHVGNAIELLSDDLSEFTGYWVFDR